MKKQNFNEASSLELVKVNGSRFAAEVVRGNARVNLSQMAKPFGKRVRDWLRTEEAQEYLYAISDAQKCASADLLEVRKGGDPLEQGTWCRDYRIALRFAQWLSPEFSIKVDEAILNLLTGRRVTPGDNGPTGTGCDRGAMVQAAGSACSELRRDESRLYEGGGSLPAQDVTDGVIDFNGMEG